MIRTGSRPFAHRIGEAKEIQALQSQGGIFLSVALMTGLEPNLMVDGQIGKSIILRSTAT
jgi:hypothetical protein